MVAVRVRPRQQDHGELERLRPGMLAGLASLAGCCVAFSVVPGSSSKP